MPDSAQTLEARSQVRALASSLIRRVADIGMVRDDTLAFWFGESDRPTADFIREAAVQSIGRGETFYSQNLGRPYLRQAISDYATALHGRAIGVERVAAVGSGVSALLLVNEALVSPGDRVVVITPIWPNVCEIPKILGGEVHRVALEARNGAWTLDLDRLLDALVPGTRMLIVNSPNNPTGWTMDSETQRVVLAHCRRHGIWIVGDDVYERLVHDPALSSAPSFQTLSETGDRLISVNSLSKAWSMTGWRVGWMLIPPELAPELAKLVEYNSSCIFEPTQRAAARALQEGEAEVASLRADVTRTRAILVDALRAIEGVEVPDAGGAMYVFFRIAGFTDSVDLAMRLVSEAGLGLAPGAAFGQEGEGWLRWCHAVSDSEKLLRGVERLRTFLATRRSTTRRNAPPAIA